LKLVMTLSRKLFALLGLMLALLLSACGPVPAASWPGVATDGELAYVAFNQKVHAINLADGREVWAFPPASSNGADTFFSEPGLSAEVIVVGSEGPASSYSGAVFGLDPRRTGAQKWCRALNERAEQRLNTPEAPCPLIDNGTEFLFLNVMPPKDDRLIGGIALAEGVAYFGTANNLIYAVEAATGQVKWAFDRAKHPTWATPLVDGDTVYVAALDHVLYALDTADGSVKWEKDLGAALGGTPALADGTLYIGTFGNRLYALDAATGDVRWTFEQATNWIWAGPTLHEGMLYFSDLNGYVYAVDAATGAQTWSVKPGDANNGKMRAAPAVLGDQLYVGDKDGKLFALNIETGATRWEKSVEGGGQLLATPIVAPEMEMVLVAPYQGSNLLVAYSANGEFKWASAP
jgi:outer membrane protein assembly factor BamB